MITEWDDEVEYTVLLKNGKTMHFEDLEEAKELFYSYDNALILSRVCTEELEMKEIK